MNNTQIREILVAHGFKLSGEDARGNPDLKPYVYEAVKAVLAAQTAPVVLEGWKPKAIQGPRKSVFYGGNTNEHLNPEVVLISAEDYKKCCELLTAAPAAPVEQKDALDTRRLDFLDGNSRFRMGWQVGVAPVGNVSVTSVVMGGKPIREAIDAAIAATAQQKGGGTPSSPAPKENSSD